MPPGKVNVNRPRKKNKKKKDKKKNDKEVNQSKDPRDRPNPHVYVTGLPPDVTADELNDHFRKCGLIRVDTDTGEPKIKIYRSASPNFFFSSLSFICVWLALLSCWCLFFS